MKAKSVGVVGLLVLTTVLAVASPPSAAAGASGWSPAAQVEFDSSDTWGVGYPLVAVAESGSAFAAWPVLVTGIPWYRTGTGAYSPESGWSPPYYWESSWTNGEFMPNAVEALPNGSFAMGARESGSTSAPTVWLHLFAGDGGYVLRMNVTQGQPITQVYAGPFVAADGTGAIVVAWVGAASSRDLFARRFVPPSSWGPVETVDNRAENVDYADLAVDAGGNATLVWTQSDGTASSAWASRYTPGVGWSTQQALEADSTAVSMVGAGASDDGSAIASWTQIVSGETSARAARFTPGSGWAAATTLSVPADGFVWLFQVAASPSGRAAAFWNQFIGGRYEPRAAFFDPDSGWSSPRLLAAGTVTAYRLAVGMDGGGRALFAFMGRVEDSGSHMFAVESDAVGEAMTAPAALDRTVTGPDWFTMDVARSGAAVVGWEQYSGEWYSVWAVARAPPDREAPALVLSAPSDGASTAEPSVTVAGTTEEGAAVAVNGVAVDVGVGGAFSAKVALGAGANTVTVVAKDAAGNLAILSRSVTYNDPSAGLQAQLSQAQASLAATQADLAAAKLQLAAAQADLAATRATLNATQASQATGAAKDAELQGKVDAAASSASTAMLVGLLGVLAGAAALAMGFMMSKKGPQSAAAPAPAPATAPAPPPPEPPKTG